MFKVGDHVKIDTPTFQDMVGVVTSVVPGRSTVVTSEFVVSTGDGQYRFFENQLVHLAEGVTESNRNT